MLGSPRGNPPWVTSSDVWQQHDVLLPSVQKCGSNPWQSFCLRPWQGGSLVSALFQVLNNGVNVAHDTCPISPEMLGVLCQFVRLHISDGRGLTLHARMIKSQPQTPWFPHFCPLSLLPLSAVLRSPLVSAKSKPWWMQLRFEPRSPIVNLRRWRVKEWSFSFLFCDQGLKPTGFPISSIPTIGQKKREISTSNGVQNLTSFVKRNPRFCLMSDLTYRGVAYSPLLRRIQKRLDQTLNNPNPILSYRGKTYRVKVFKTHTEINKWRTPSLSFLASLLLVEQWSFANM